MLSSISLNIRQNQHKAVKAFLEGNDVFLSLPTGSKKSLCYTILPFAFDDLYGREGSLAIIVSPLKRPSDKAIVIVCSNITFFYPPRWHLYLRKVCLQLMPLARRTYPSLQVLFRCSICRSVEMFLSIFPS